MQKARSGEQAFCRRVGRSELLDADVAETDARTVSQQADVSLLVEESRVVASVHCVGILRRTVGGDVVSLAGFADVAVENHLAVHRHRDPVAYGADLLDVPGSQLAELDALGRDDAVNRSVLLVDLDVLVDRIVVVEHLNLHAVEGGIDAHRGT